MNDPRQLIVALATLWMVGCRPSTPAENPARSEEPAPAPEVWLEVPAAAPDAPQAIDAPGLPVHPAALVVLYACWFERPYEYMFTRQGPTLRVGEREWGSFTAGVNGILNYGSLAHCARTLGGDDSRGGFGDHKPIEMLSGLSLRVDDGDASKPFGFYNSEVVRWGHSYLIPDPRERILGATAADIYAVVFSRYFRLMAESYADLHKDEGRYEAEQKAYWAMAKKATLPKARPYMGIEWLEQRYARELHGHPYGGSFDGTQWTVPMAYGFWLRRGIDGTNEELWLGLKKLLVRYDRGFLDQLEKDYPRADFSAPT